MTGESAVRAASEPGTRQDVQDCTAQIRCPVGQTEKPLIFVCSRVSIGGDETELRSPACERNRVSCERGESASHPPEQIGSVGDTLVHSLYSSTDGRHYDEEVLW